MSLYVCAGSMGSLRAGGCVLTGVAYTLQVEAPASPCLAESGMQGQGHCFCVTNVQPGFVSPVAGDALGSPSMPAVADQPPDVLGA